MDLLLPNHPDFYKALDELPLPFDFAAGQCVIQRADSLILEAVSAKEAIDYAFGGEHELVDDDFDDFDDEDFEDGMD
jgi:hypothetical protein